MNDLILFLQKRFPSGVQMFNTKNIVGDTLINIYKDNLISVDYCTKWDYIEIFGLKQSEFELVRLLVNTFNII